MPSARSRHAFSLVLLFPDCPAVKSWVNNSFTVANSKFVTQPVIRLVSLLLAIGLSGWVISSTARIGLSRLFVKYSLLTGNAAVADQAVQMSPKDAETHRARSAVLNLSQPEASVSEMEHAVALRPHDYALWVDLGLIRDQAGDAAGALAAFDEAVKRAPFYALPRWQRGNLLLRVGKYDAAFDDLNRAAQSNPDLVPNFIDLAWNLAQGDPKVVEQIVRVDSKVAHTTMAKYFASHGKPQEAIDQFQAAGTTDEDTTYDVVSRLIGKGSFAEAYQVWSAAHGVTRSGQSGPIIFDGGFESSLSFDEGGFSWQIPRHLQAATVSLDSSQPHSGAKNLRIEFSGDSNPGTDLVSQLVLVEPGRRYKINFAARSQEIVSGGLPLIIVKDAGPDHKPLGQSQSWPKGSSSWNVISFEFSTQSNTHAVVISIQREGCSAPPCPIFGVISLDSVSIEQLQ